MVGNAVPVMMAKIIATAIKKQIESFIAKNKNDFIDERLVS
jgi:hypothetical protein